VWWPPFDAAHRIYTVARPPVWDELRRCYVDRETHAPLPTWEQAMAALDQPGAEPGYVVRLGRIDARGITAGTKDAKKAIAYVTKYLTKDLLDTARPRSAAQQAHADRLHAELAVTPCSPGCPNWLLYGVQPKDATRGLAPGRCPGKVHQRSTLGYTGRRVLISRQWSGKTLADLRADNRTWVRAILSGTLANPGPDHPDTAGEEPRRYIYELARADDPDVPELQVRISHAIAIRQRWRQALRDAQTQTAAPPGANSATQDPEAIGRAA